MAGKDQHRGDQPDHPAVLWLASGIRHPDAYRAKIGKGLSHAYQRVSSAERIRYCSDIQQPVRMGEERARGWRLRTEDPWEKISAFIAKDRAGSHAAAIPCSSTGRAEDRGCGRVH